MKILLTGGQGFVGVNIARFLSEKDQIILTGRRDFDALTMQFLGEHEKNIHFAKLDIQDRAAIERIVKEHKVDTIVHAAGITAGKPEDFVDINIIGALNVLQVGYLSDTVERILNFSSSGVYGPGSNDKNDYARETDPPELWNFYSAAKYSVETVINNYQAVSNSKRFASLRLGSMYGFMENGTPSRPGISQMGKLISATLNKQHLRLHGKNVFRDWVFSEDVGLAVQSLLYCDDWQYQVYNISSGEVIRFEDLINIFDQYDLSYEWVKDSEIADIKMDESSYRQALDMTRLKTNCGFTPQYSLEEGIAALLKK